MILIPHKKINLNDRLPLWRLIRVYSIVGAYKFGQMLIIAMFLWFVIRLS